LSSKVLPQVSVWGESLRDASHSFEGLNQLLGFYAVCCSFDSLLVCGGGWGSQDVLHDT